MKIIIPWFKFLIELHETTGKAFAFPGVFILIGLATLPAWTQSADFINDPQSNNAKIGDVFSVTIQVAPTDTEVSVAEVHLNFDPNRLQVVSLTPAGSPLDNTIIPAAFDNIAGTIKYGAYTLSNYPNTTFDFLTIEFEAVGLTPGTQVTHELENFPVSLIAFEDVDLLDVANPIDVAITDPNQDVECEEVLFRVNNGGVQTAAGDASTPDWGEDTQDNPSPYVTLGSNNTFTTGTAIDMTHPSLAGTGITQAILQTERWVNTTPPGMQWDFPVTPGSQIQIKLFFAELFVNNPGERVFDVAVEGVVPPAFDNIDPIALAGAKFKGVMLSHDLTVNDDNLDLDFLHVIQNPALKAIEVCLASGEPPFSIICPDTQSGMVDDDCGFLLPDYTGMAMVIGSSDPTVSIAQSPEAGTIVTSNTMVTLTATDDEGNSANCAFLVTILNDTPPAITCPDDISVENDPGLCGAFIFWDEPDYSDDCPGTVLSGTDESGDFFPIGKSTVFLTVTDASGNTTECSFNIMVADTEAPVFENCPASVTVAAGSPDCEAEASWTPPIAADNCPDPSVTFSHTPGDIFSFGMTTVTYTAVDAPGNSAVCSFTVTVEDQTPPSITCPSNQDGTLDANGEFILPLYSALATVSDNCDQNVSLAQNPDAGTIVTDNTTVTLTATDDAGNTSSCTFQVFLSDQGNISISCPDNQNGTLNLDCEFVLLDYSDLATVDNGNGEVTIVQSPAEGTIITDNTIVMLTATDETGNSTSCTFLVAVEIPSGGLPPGWSNQDIGASNPPGFAEFAACGGELTLGSTGFNGQKTKDALHIAYQELCGDGTITAQVTGMDSPTGINGWAGVTFRKNLTVGSPFASLLTRLSNFVYRRFRTTQGGLRTTHHLFRPGATWLRMERSGNTITGYTSINGNTWSFAFATNVNLGDCILVGLTAEGYNPVIPITATFNNISITGFGIIPPVQPPAGSPALSQTLGISLYPNPVDEGFNVILENAPEGEVELEIIDLNGRQLYRRIVDGEMPYIEMNLQPLGLPDGVYILRIWTGNQFFTERFVKRKIY
jgi:hypothetical protein